MIQEYLFTSDKYKKELETLDVRDKVQKKIISIKNSLCWTLCLSIDGENEEVAKILDLLNKQICEKYRPTVLSNGCSAYFNKSLFPMANEFERKLRKLLYLASALQEDNSSHEVIENLESKDLGKIFDTLFTDVNFINKVKEQVNSKTWKFTRNELIATINDLEEDTLWDALPGTERVKTLCEKFNDLRIYRNDIMHAHNISWEQFKVAKRLFQKVNMELDIAIEELIDAKEENETMIPADFNIKLRSALMSIQKQSTPDLREKWDAFLISLQNSSSQTDINALNEKFNKLSSIQPVLGQETEKTLSALKEINMNEWISQSKYAESIPNLEELVALQNDIPPAIKAMNNMARQLKNYKISMPPEVEKLQNNLSKINGNTVSKNYGTVQIDEEES